MGYYTTYTLKVYPEHRLESIRQAFYNLDDCDCFDGVAIKWDECDDDCLRISKLHPSVLFSVYGDGGENGALWRKDYIDGHCVGGWKADPICSPDADPELIAQAIKNGIR